MAHLPLSRSTLFSNPIFALLMAGLISSTETGTGPDAVSPRQAFNRYEAHSGDIMVATIDDCAQPFTVLKLYADKLVSRSDLDVLVTAERDARALMAWSDARQAGPKFANERKELDALRSYVGVTRALDKFWRGHHLSQEVMIHYAEGLGWVSDSGRTNELVAAIREEAFKTTGARLSTTPPVAAPDDGRKSLSTLLDEMGQRFEIHEAAVLELATKARAEPASPSERLCIVPPESADHWTLCAWTKKSGRLAELRAIEDRITAERAAQKKAADEVATSAKVDAPVVARDRTGFDLLMVTPEEAAKEVLPPFAKPDPIRLITPAMAAARVGGNVAANPAPFVDAADFGEQWARLKLSKSHAGKLILANITSDNVDVSNLESVTRAALDYAHARLLALFPNVYQGDAAQIRRMADDVLAELVVRAS